MNNEYGFLTTFHKFKNALTAVGNFNNKTFNYTNSTIKFVVLAFSASNYISVNL